MTNEQNSKTKLIADTLREEAVSGCFPSGRFPSEAQVIRRFGVARQTAVKAIEILVRENIVVRRRGAGSFVAKRLRKATGVIGIIVPGLAYAEIFAPICSSLASILSDRGYSLQLADFSDDNPAALADKAIQVAEDFVEKGVDGVIFYPIEFLPNSAEINDSIASRLSAADIPVVLLDGDLSAPSKRSLYDIVSVDNFVGGYAIADHLLRQGVQRIAFLMRNHWANSVKNRMYGVSAACVAAGLGWSEANIFRSEPDDARKVAALMKSARRPQAIVCGNDTAAMKLQATIHALGYGIPEDVLVAGFDDVQNARFATPPITTVRQPLGDIAQTLVETLFARRRHPDGAPHEIVLHAAFVARESTNAARLKWWPDKKTSREIIK